jgi:hypothetical protein
LIVRIGVVLALAGGPAISTAAPLRCDGTLTPSLTTVPTGVQRVSVRVPGIHPDVRLHASTGTTGLPVAAGLDQMVADVTLDSRPPPLVVVGAVGGSFCGFTVIRVASADAAEAGPVTLVAVEPAGVPGDREGTAIIYAFAVDERGTPRTGPAPGFRPDAGRVDEVHSLGPGMWRARWRLPPAKAETNRVTVAFGSEAPAQGSVARDAGRPATLEVSEDPASNVDGIPGAVIVRVLDSSGNLTDGAVNVESDQGTVGPLVRLERGVYHAPLSLPKGARGSLYVTANSNRIFASTMLSIVPVAGPAARVTVEPRAAIRADGSSPGMLLIFPVSVVDASGNPASDGPVGSAGLGKFLEPLFVSPGSWMLPYRPPRVLVDSVDHLVVRAGNASAQVDQQLLASQFSVSVGAKAGIAISQRLGPAVGFDASAWWFLGHTQLGVTFDLSWWTFSQTSTPTVGSTPASYEARQHFLPALLSLSWRTVFASEWLLWATGGGGICPVWNSAQISGQSPVSESGLAPAASASLSVGPRVGPGSPFLEARVTWIGDPKLSTLTGSSITALILVGYRFDVR